MKALIIQNNIAQALEYFYTNKDYEKVIYLSCDNAKAKKVESQILTYKFLKEFIPNIEYVSRNELLKMNFSSGTFYGPDAYDEKVIIKRFNLESGEQNRLLKNYDFHNIKTFTPFRMKVEPTLPNIYEDGIYQPKDQELENELQYYFQKNHLAKNYFNIRNGVLGRDYSTKLSTFLSTGRLNVRYLYNYISEYERNFGENKSTYWLKFELLWREYFYWCHQKHQQKLFSLHGIDGPKSFERNIPELEYQFLFEKDPFMFSVCQELISTGFISNRFRQVFASSLINTYNIDWRIGAKFFEDHLIDYDVYSNWGNWQYLAGVGSDPRGIRVFNTMKQLKDYDSELKYIKTWTNMVSKEEILKSLIKIYN